MVRYSSNKIFKTLTYSQVDRITTNLACEWAKNVKDAGVISYINDSGVNYMLTMIALMKLRSVLFVISPRNSEAAVTELLKNTKSKTFFAAKKYEAVARSAASKLGDVNVIIIDPLNIESLLEQPLNDKYNNIIDSNFTENDIDKPALIIHSSGSTNFPKPITISNRYLLNVIGCFKHYNEHYPHLDVINQNDISLVCLPL
ncbi:hypothetical protein G6F56_006915 [Rhizopus delemar]|nr:hypothetical protein G6F56_006915 [Rhizopus delemar]